VRKSPLFCARERRGGKKGNLFGGEKKKSLPIPDWRLPKGKKRGLSIINKRTDLLTTQRVKKQRSTRGKKKGGLKLSLEKKRPWKLKNKRKRASD